MKKIYLVFLSLLSISVYSQEVIKKNMSSQPPPPANNLTINIDGPDVCCSSYPSETFSYDIYLSNVSWYHSLKDQEITITNGVITKVNGTTLNPPSSTYNSPTWSDITIEVDWDDNDLHGNIHARLYYYWGLISFKKDKDKSTLINHPLVPAPINVSNSNPYVGEVVSCSTAGADGADTYLWSCYNGSINNTGTTTTSYTPAYAGNGYVQVMGHNQCGDGPYTFKNLTVNQYAPLGVTITGPLKANNSGWYDWVGHVSGGKPPYDYHWYYSYTGNNYNNTWATTYNTNSSTDIQTKQMPIDYDLYLKLVVTDDLNNQSVDYFLTLNTSGWKSVNADSINDFIDNNSLQNIYPNPTKGQLIIPLFYKKKYSSLYIYNSNGTSIRQFKNIPSKVNLRNEPDGIYYFKFNNLESNIEKIIKIIKKN